MFTRDTAGDLTSGWSQAAKLTAQDGTAFGGAVSIDGDTVVIGARYDDDDYNSGAAYVFRRDMAGDLASSWSQVAKLTANDGAADDYFGITVSIDDDTIVIGAYQDDRAGTRSGSAYVFTRDTAGDLASSWSQVTKLTPSASIDRFGSSVSIDGDTMVIGANFDSFERGVAYVFTRATAGDLTSGWSLIRKLTANDGTANDYFGSSVSIDGDTVVIGAGGDDTLDK